MQEAVATKQKGAFEPVNPHFSVKCAKIRGRCVSKHGELCRDAALGEKQQECQDSSDLV